MKPTKCARRDFLKSVGTGAGVLLADALTGSPLLAGERPEHKPNIIVILADDMGYGDVGVYGATGLSTPNLDRMATRGMRFTDFYAGAAICSPSRAALLTGCYPQRVDIPSVLGPNARTGINSREILLPTILKELGYRSAIIGKWHLGHHSQFLPLRHGFDEFFGTPGSNDSIYENTDLRAGVTGKGILLYENDKVIETAPYQRQLTTRYTDRAIQFIEQNRRQRFFLYLAHNMPHTPLAVSNRFAGKTVRGLYGDVIAELDGSVGEVLEAVNRNGIEDNTLVIFTSDNGPWLIFGDHGGSAGSLRGGKKQLFEGGVRVPCLMQWPGKIPAGAVCQELVTMMDILPTVTKLTGGRLPAHEIDGYDIWPLMADKRGAQSPRDTFYYYWQYELHAVRWGKWKLRLPHTDSQAPDPGQIGYGGKRGEVPPIKYGLALYNLEEDRGETTDVAAQHPDLVKRLLALAQQARTDLGDEITKQKGEKVRPPGDLRKAVR